MENLSLSPLCSDAGFLTLLGTSTLARTDEPPSCPPSPTGSKSRRAGRSAIGNRVLLFGRLRELALYRAEVLSNRGFKVLIPRTKEEARDAIQRRDFDVAVFTYTLPSDMVEELADLLRESHPECPLIAITDAARSDRKIDPDETVLADDGPVALIAAIRRVIGHT